MAVRCTLCNGTIAQRFLPMKQWGIDGPLCGECYSKKIAEHYPGEHVRVDTSENM